MEVRGGEINNPHLSSVEKEYPRYLFKKKEQSVEVEIDAS